MRIGLNLLYLIPGVVGGSEVYATSLIRELAAIDSKNEYFVFLNRESSNLDLVKAENFRYVICPFRAHRRIVRYLWEQLVLPVQAMQYRLDILHSLGYVSPLLLPCRSVVSILDLVYNYPGALSAPQRRILETLVAASARTADRIITISETSQQEIVSVLRVQLDNVKVTLLAPKQREPVKESDWCSVATRLGIQGAYLLAFSSLSPSKNIPALLRAFAILREEGIDLQLVLVGHQPRRGMSLNALCESLHLGQHVILTGYLPDTEVSLLLENTTLFAFPSLYEGFGLPILEAMAAGVPVACSRAASLPEVAGKAAVLFDPRSDADMAAKLKLLIEQPAQRCELIQKGYQNLKRFSWQATARETLRVYESVGRVQPQLLNEITTAR